MIVPRPRSGVTLFSGEDVGGACARPSKNNALAPCLFRLDSEAERCAAWVWSSSQCFVHRPIQVTIACRAPRALAVSIQTMPRTLGTSAADGVAHPAAPLYHRRDHGRGCGEARVRGPREARGANRLQEVYASLTQCKAGPLTWTMGQDVSSALLWVVRTV